MQQPVPPGVSQSTIDHFRSIPWLRPTLEDPNFQIVDMSRTVTHDGRGHTLTGKTWNTDSTIRELLCLARASSSPTPMGFPQTETERAEVRRFYTFGTDLNAHPDLLHGGVITALLDSSLGGAVGFVLQESIQNGASVFTVQLNVTFKKPVKTPGTVMVRSWVTRVEGEGRKVWAKGVIEGEGGVVHAEGEGLWVRARCKEEKL